MTLNQVAQIQAGFQYNHKYNVYQVSGQMLTLMMLSMQWIRKRLAQDPALKYQFLRLDQPQNISIDKINQFLKVKVY